MNACGMCPCRWLLGALLVLAAFDLYVIWAPADPFKRKIPAVVDMPLGFRAALFGLVVANLVSIASACSHAKVRKLKCAAAAQPLLRWPGMLQQTIAGVTQVCLVNVLAAHTLCRWLPTWLTGCPSSSTWLARNMWTGEDCGLLFVADRWLQAWHALEMDTWAAPHSVCYTQPMTGPNLPAPCCTQFTCRKRGTTHTQRRLSAARKGLGPASLPRRDVELGVSGAARGLLPQGAQSSSSTYPAGATHGHGMANGGGMNGRA